MFRAIAIAAINRLRAIQETIRATALARRVVAAGLVENVVREYFPGGSIEDETELRVYEHCAVLTRAYGVYERFVSDLISNWLGRVPMIWQTYDRLPDAIRAQHRRGIGKLLVEYELPGRPHVVPQDAISGLADGLAGREYKLLPEAFLQRDRNLRLDALANCLALAGIEGIRGWLERSAELKASLPFDVHDVERAVARFIELRNEAAHGSTDEILSGDELISVVGFVEQLVGAIEEGASHRWVTHMFENGHLGAGGVVTEVFRIPGAAIVTGDRLSLALGDEIIGFSSSACRIFRIESMRVEGVDCEAITVLNGLELGVCAGPLRVGMRIFRLHEM